MIDWNTSYILRQAIAHGTSLGEAENQPSKEWHDHLGLGINNWPDSQFEIENYFVEDIIHMFVCFMLTYVPCNNFSSEIN